MNTNHITRKGLHASALTVALTGLLVGTPAIAFADPAPAPPPCKSCKPLPASVNMAPALTGSNSGAGGAVVNNEAQDPELTIDGDHWTVGDDIKVLVNYPPGLKDNYGRSYATGHFKAEAPYGTIHVGTGCTTGPSTAYWVSVSATAIATDTTTNDGHYSNLLPVTLLQWTNTSKIICG